MPYTRHQLRGGARGVQLGVLAGGAGGGGLIVTERKTSARGLGPGGGWQDPGRRGACGGALGVLEELLRHQAIQTRTTCAVCRYKRVL
jgi:hypothetical protein